MRKFYASQSPRGFCNDIIVHSFSSKKARDSWVKKHAGDGDVNAAYIGANVITAQEARKIIGYDGDSTTVSYNRTVDHD